MSTKRRRLAMGALALTLTLGVGKFLEGRTPGEVPAREWVSSSSATLPNQVKRDEEIHPKAPVAVAKFRRRIDKELPRDELVEPGKLPLPRTMKKFLVLADKPLRSGDEQKEFESIRRSQELVAECVRILEALPGAEFTWAEATTRIMAVKTLEKAGTSRSGGVTALASLLRGLLQEEEGESPLLVVKSRRGDLLELARTLGSENQAVLAAVLREFEHLPKTQWLLRSLAV